MDNKQNYGIVHRMNRLTFIQKALALPAAMLPYAVFARTKTPSIDNGYLHIKVVLDEVTDIFTVTGTYSNISGDQIAVTNTGKISYENTVDLRPFCSQVKGDLLARGIKDYQTQKEVVIEYV